MRITPHFAIARSSWHIIVRGRVSLIPLTNWWTFAVGWEGLIIWERHIASTTSSSFLFQMISQMIMERRNRHKFKPTKVAVLFPDIFLHGCVVPHGSSEMEKLHISVHKSSIDFYSSYEHSTCAVLNTPLYQTNFLMVLNMVLVVILIAKSTFTIFPFTDKRSFPSV